LLLEAGANPCGPVRAGLSPWLFAVGDGRTEVLDAFLSPQVMAGIERSEIHQAWDMALLNGHFDVIETMWNLGVSLKTGSAGMAWLEQLAQHPHQMSQGVYRRISSDLRKHRLNEGLPPETQDPCHRERF